MNGMDANGPGDDMDYHAWVGQYADTEDRWQIAYPAEAGGNLWQRVRTGSPSIWSAWSKIAFESDVVSYAASLLDVRRNRIVNPCMQVSQENENTAGTSAPYYVADQWVLGANFATAAFSIQRVQSTTPAGSKDRLRATITTADAALDAGDHLTIFQPIEGARVADFLFGTANARPGVIRVGMNFPQGTWCVALLNAALDRSYVAEVVISAAEAGTDVVKEISFTGDTSGVWPTGDVKSWDLRFTIAAGATYRGVAGWQSGLMLATGNQTNGASSTANVFEVFDVGLRRDPDGTGDYGQFEVPDPANVLRDCMRYWVERGLRIQVGGGVDSSYVGNTVYFPVPMRASPSMSYRDASGTANRVTTSGSGDNQTPSAGSIMTNGTRNGFESDALFSAANNWVYFTWTANARM
ncbi:hypothetical protein [Nitratireductor thuwali]|uniref:Minor tail protein n=1 Tax=Nitratireductor thuwali TaxID=2267699 RepID=A0ABY5MNC4_9HYPH|nr:hypothetical protein NTH_03996 [Nitratireductor thuwali]